MKLLKKKPLILEFKQKPKRGYKTPTTNPTKKTFKILRLSKTPAKFSQT
jgi:hypothetical protein